MVRSAGKLAARTARRSLGAMRELFSDHRVETDAIAHPLGFGPHGKIGVQASDRRQVQTLQHCMETGPGQDAKRAVCRAACGMRGGG